MSAASPLHELISLAHEPSSARRRELLRRVTDLFLAEARVRPPSEAAAFDGVFCTLAAEMETEVRAELAQRFGAAAHAPAALAARLARDCIEVALPILANANLLSEADLLEVTRSQGQGHLRVVSSRPGLTEAVSDVIVERADDETLGVLVRNDQAAFSRAASEQVVARAQANPALHAAVVGRSSLPLDLVNEMYFVVETRLREQIRVRNASADPKAVEAALAMARSRLAARAAAAGENYAAAETEVARAAERRRLNGPALLAWLRGGERALFVAGLARMAEIDTATLGELVGRSDLDALAIVCKAADLDKAMFLTFAVLVGEARDAMSRAAAYGKLYADLPRDAALRTLRFWRIRCEGEPTAVAA